MPSPPRPLDAMNLSSTLFLLFALLLVSSCGDPAPVGPDSGRPADVGPDLARLVHGGPGADGTLRVAVVLPEARDGRLRGVLARVELPEGAEVVDLFGVDGTFAVGRPGPGSIELLAVDPDGLEGAVVAFELRPRLDVGEVARLDTGALRLHLLQADRGELPEAVPGSTSDRSVDGIIVPTGGFAARASRALGVPPSSPGAEYEGPLLFGDAAAPRDGMVSVDDVVECALQAVGASPRYADPVEYRTCDGAGVDGRIDVSDVVSIALFAVGSPESPTRIATPVPEPVSNPLTPSGWTFDVDLSIGEIAVSGPTGPLAASGSAPGPQRSILAGDVIRIVARDPVESPGPGGLVRTTLEVAVESVLPVVDLVAPTFPIPPTGTGGPLLIPFEVAVLSTGGAENSTVELLDLGLLRPSTDWDVPPHDFFNGAACGPATEDDCVRSEEFLAIVGGTTSEFRRVGFIHDPGVTQFRFRALLAADLVDPGA